MSLIMKASPLKKKLISLQFQVAIDQKAGKLHNFDITVNLHISSLKQKIDPLQLDVNESFCKVCNLLFANLILIGVLFHLSK